MPAAHASPERPAPISLWSAIALVIGYTIGVGIFLTPAELIGTVASPALTFALWIGCSLLALAGALTFGELVSRLPRAGGVYVFLREGWGGRIAFLYCWQSLLLMDPGVAAALATGAAPYVTVIWPAAAGHDRAIALALLWSLTGVTLLGVRLSTRTMAWLTVGKIVALLIIVAFALASHEGRWSNFSAPAAPMEGGLPMGAALAIGLISVFFSFGGFWDASRIADQVVNPSRNVALALTGGVGAISLLYIATTAAFIYLVPPSAATTPPEFARRAGEAMFGGAGATIFATIVLVSVISSALGLLIMAPRLYVAMSADGLLPRTLATEAGRSGTSVRATIVLAVIASAFIWLGSFGQILTLFICPTLAFVALAAASLVRLRRTGITPAFTAPAYPWVVVLFVALLTLVIVAVALNQPLQALGGVVVVLFGLPAYESVRTRFSQ